MPSLASLPAKDADRLAKLAGMLGSAHDGEVVNAARAAASLLRRNGLTWRDALTPALPRSVPPVPVTPMPQHQRAAAECLAWQEVLTDWEFRFCADVKSLSRLTPNQQATLNRIWEKVKRCAARERARHA